MKILIFILLFNSYLFSLDNSWKNVNEYKNNINSNEVSFYYFHSVTCPYCKKLEQNYLNKKEFYLEFKDFNKYSLYPNKELISKNIFKNTFKSFGYPTFIISLPILEDNDNFFIIRNRINPKDKHFNIIEYNKNINNLISDLYLKKITYFYKNKIDYLELSKISYRKTKNPDFLYYSYIHYINLFTPNKIKNRENLSKALKVLEELKSKHSYYRYSEIEKEIKKLNEITKN